MAEKDILAELGKEPEHLQNARSFWETVTRKIASGYPDLVVEGGVDENPADVFADIARFEHEQGLAGEARESIGISDFLDRESADSTYVFVHVFGDEKRRIERAVGEMDAVARPKRGKREGGKAGDNIKLSALVTTDNPEGRLHRKRLRSDPMFRFT